MDLEGISKMYPAQQRPVSQEEGHFYNKGPTELPRMDLQSFELSREELKKYIAEMLDGKWGEFEIFLGPHPGNGYISLCNWTQMPHVGGLAVYNLPYRSSESADAELEKIFQAISDAHVEKISLHCEDIADGQVGGIINSDIIQILSRILPQSDIKCLELYAPIGFHTQDSLPSLYGFVEALTQSKVRDFAWRQIQVGFSGWGKQKTISFLLPLLTREELTKLESFWDGAEIIR